MGNILLEWLRRIQGYPKLMEENSNFQIEIQNLKKILIDYENLKKESTKLKDNFISLKEAYDRETNLKVPQVEDHEYWNNKWRTNSVFYPSSKRVTSYLSYRDISRIDDIALEINTHDLKVDMIPLVVMTWIQEYGPKYKFDVGEKWNTPEETIDQWDKGADCEDVAFLSYFIIRKIFMLRDQWEHVKHRLKCQDLYVYSYSSNRAIMNPAGRHLAMLWLASDGEWYTVESTYYLNKAINYYLQVPQRKSRRYGMINYTFNEEFSWSQNRITLRGVNYSKVED